MKQTVKGIPGAQCVHHVAYTVPDLDQAVEFFVNVIGAVVLYRLGPVKGDGDDWMERKLNVDRHATAKIAMLRLGPVTNLELFEYTSPEQNKNLPRNSDWGGHHLAIHVDDVERAVAYLKTVPGVKILGDAETINEGPISGDCWVYFLTPWGMQMEVLNMPPGMPYENETDARLYARDDSWASAS